MNQEATDLRRDSQPVPPSLVWDLPTRLFHWLLVFCLAGSWITAEEFDWFEYHFLFGYTSLGLIIFRILWGFIGPTHARFSTFVKGPVQVFNSARQLLNRNPSPYVGHNPVGGWSTVLFLAVVATQATTGLFISDDIFYAGPYNAVVSSSTAGELAGIHHLNFNVLQALVVIHLCAIIWYQWGKRTALIKPMISGRKTLPAEQAAQAISHSHLLRAAVLASVVAAGIVALVQLAPPPAPMSFF
ncbi:MAG: cytochrome b/b6 domain-containing protein [bacterium]